MRERGSARLVARFACAAATALACHAPAVAQSTGSAELDPAAPLAPLPDLGVEWPDMNAPDVEVPIEEPQAPSADEEEPAAIDVGEERR